MVLDEALKQVFHHSLDGIVITEPDTTMCDFNPAYERIVGYTAEEMRGRPVGMIKSDQTPPEVYREMWDSLFVNGLWMGELINRRRNGEEWVCYLSITRLSGPNGELRGFVGIVRDISTHLKAETTLKDKLSELAATKDVTIHALAFMAENKDPDIGGHLDRLQIYTSILCDDLLRRDAFPHLLNEDLAEEIVKTSLLHDVGKVGVPEGILFKPAKLSAEEFQVMQLHTRYGGRILGDADNRLRSHLGVSATFMSVAREIAQHHHERWDGKGYPDGLGGEDIPLSARIVAVADVYDALTSRRVYKQAWSHAQSRELILTSAGSHFDRRVVEAFQRREDEFDHIRLSHREAAAG